MKHFIALTFIVNSLFGGLTAMPVFAMEDAATHQESVMTPISPDSTLSCSSESLGLLFGDRVPCFSEHAVTIGESRSECDRSLSVTTSQTQETQGTDLVFDPDCTGPIASGSLEIFVPTVHQSIASIVLRV